jgi:hypothetical protein
VLWLTLGVASIHCLHHNREHEALQQCGQAGAVAGRYAAALAHSRSTLAAAQQRTAAAAAQLYTAEISTHTAAATAHELAQQRAAVHTGIAEATVPTLTSSADVSLAWSQRLQRGTAMARRRSELTSRTLLRTAFTALQQHTVQQRLVDQFVARRRGKSLLCALSNWRATVVRNAAVKAAAAAALRRRAVRSLAQWRSAAVCGRAVSVRSHLQLRKAARHCVAHWRQQARTAAQSRTLCRHLQARRAQRSALQHWRTAAAAATAAVRASSMQLSAPQRAAEAVVARAAKRALAGRCFAVWRVQVIEVGHALQCRSRAMWGLRMWRRRCAEYASTLLSYYHCFIEAAAISII